MPLDKVKHPYPTSSLFVPSLVVNTGTGTFNGITGLSSTGPIASGTAAAGASTAVARADHVHPTTGLGLTSGTLAQFASTTSLQLAGVISDETGSGSLVFNTSPSFSTALSTPRINFTGGTSTISAFTLADGTISYEGSAGQLFSISNSLTGVIFSVNDISGLPNIEVTDAGLIRINEIYGQAVFGSGTAIASTQISAIARTSATIPIAVRGASGQSVNLQEWQVSGPTTVSAINSLGVFIAPAATTAIPSIRLPHGTAPTSPTNGDVWTTTAGMYVRVNGATVGPLGAGLDPTAQIVSTRASNVADGQGQIYLNGATGNRVDFNQNGVAAPAFTTRSLGAKIVLFPNIAGATTDFAIGIESSNMWFSTGENLSTRGFKWYGGTTERMSLRGDGTLSLNSTSLTLGNGGTANNTTHQIGIISGTATNIVSVIRGATSQTGALTQWQDSAGAVLASMSSAGAFSAVSKSFDIEHPTKEGMRLRYGSLEGPENGVYVRGKSKEKIISLPDYWTGLVDSDSITVQLTAVGMGTIYVDFVANNSIKVGGTAEEFYYFVQAERKDVDKLTVEY